MTIPLCPVGYDLKTWALSHPEVPDSCACGEERCAFDERVVDEPACSARSGSAIRAALSKDDRTPDVWEFTARETAKQAISLGVECDSLRVQLAEAYSDSEDVGRALVSSEQHCLMLEAKLAKVTQECDALLIETGKRSLARAEAAEKERNGARAEVEKLKTELDEQQKSKDGAYSERNQCVALLARMALALGFPAGTGKHPDEDKAWEDDWRTIVFVDLPSGQVSWHFHDSESELLVGLPGYLRGWDGHTTEEKYRRVAVARFERDAALASARAVLGGGK